MRAMESPDTPLLPSDCKPRGVISNVSIFSDELVRNIMESEFTRSDIRVRYAHGQGAPSFGAPGGRRTHADSFTLF